jgi:nucleoside-triphosphatase THEP1
VILLAGPRFSGKSRLAERLARELTAEGLRVSGFVQRGVFDGAGNKQGYDLVDLAANSCRPLARIRPDRRHHASAHAPPLRLPERGPGGEVRGPETGSWVFDEAAFAHAATMIEPGADLVIVDEVGPLELAGGGHLRALLDGLTAGARVLLVVREELAGEFAALLAPRAAVTRVRYDPRTEDEIAKRIRELLFGE